MNHISKLAKFAEDRVKKFGAQYYTFAIFGVINYPLAYLYELYSNNFNSWSWLRILAALLCCTLLLRNKWPEKCHKFLAVYWYVTITLSLPVLATIMLLKSDLSLEWLMNFNIGVMILILIVDSISFLIIELLGITLGILLCYISGGSASIYQIINHEYSPLFFYMLFCIVVLGSIFTRNKEVYNDFMQKAKDDLNEHLERKVKERTLELEDALASKTEFLNNMSHEIRTPLQGFTTLSEGLVEHWKNFTEEKKVSLASQVASNARRLASLVSNLLDLSKFNASKMIMDFREMDLKDTIENIIEECNELYLSNKKIQITFEKCEQAIITGDQDRILQVLRNLFANAIKFVPDDGSIKVSLEKTELKGKEAFHFIIEDTGVGIPEDEIKAIFEPFTQSTTTKTKAGGTGLGLSICKQIIHAHHGKIWAENNKNGVGAKFHFILPILQVSDTLALIHNSSLSVNKSDLEATILMIDDEEVCLASMELLIVNTSFSLIKAAGGAAGLAYLKAHYDIVDVILLDLMMPDIYGLSILEEIRKDSNLAHIPVILQSGTSDKNEIEKAYAMGISSFISKPYEREVVISAIADALKSSSSL